jgi:hypothetical protein
MAAVAMLLVAAGLMSTKLGAAPCAGAPTNVQCNNTCAQNPIAHSYCKPPSVSSEFNEGVGSGCAFVSTGAFDDFIDTLTGQTVTKWEYVCQDDGSHDCTGEQYEVPVEFQCVIVPETDPYFNMSCQTDTAPAILVLHKTNKKCSGVTHWYRDPVNPPPRTLKYNSDCKCIGTIDMDYPAECEWTVCNCSNCP